VPVRNAVTSAALALAVLVAIPAVAGAALPAPVPCAAAAGGDECWDPEPTTEPWQWQLQGRIDLSVPAPVYDIDGLDSSAAVVDDIHAQGDRAICYVSVGTHEPFRDDADEFPKSVLGRPLEPPFGEELWLDIRKLGRFKPILEARFDECAAKGFDAVEPDNVDAYQNRSGFPLKPSDQLEFNAWVANAVHERGMAVGLKNDLGQVKALLRYFDFAVNEQCFQYRECGVLSRFIKAGKPVYGAEYEIPPSRFCERSLRLGFSTISKKYSLKAPRRTC
jgi:hypothetical protein